MNDQFSDKLYAVSVDIGNTVDALSLIMDALWDERNTVSDDATAATAKYFCGRLDRYFSAYGMLFSRLQTIASTLEDMAGVPLAGEVSPHG